MERWAGQRQTISFTPLVSKPAPSHSFPSPTKPNRSISTNSGYLRQFTRFQEILTQFEQENDQLSQLLTHLDNAPSSPAQKQLLFQDFESEFSRQMDRLEARRKKLDNLEDILNSFRGFDDPELPTIPPSPPQSPHRTHLSTFVLDRSHAPPQSLVIIPLLPPAQPRPNPTPSNQKPSHRPHSVLRTLQRIMNESKPKKESLDVVRIDLLKENDRLREIALYQERSWLLQKLKRRLFRDHRDLSSLRKALERWKSGEVEFTQESEVKQEKEIEKTKHQIANLKQQIGREKIRIESISEMSMEDKAAVKIQSFCRGVLYRKNIVKQRVRE
jgi:ribosomal protein L20A (L18A)